MHQEDQKPADTEITLDFEPKFISQAQRIVEKFGGARRLAAALKAIGKPKDYSTIYRWLYPRGRTGTGGLIPSGSLPDVLQAAKYEGIFLTQEDTDPRPTAIKIKNKRRPNHERP